MIKEYNNKSLAFGLPGLVIQFAGMLMVNFRPELNMLGNVLVLAGTVLLFAGLGYYAKAKGHHPAWCVFGLLSLLGFVVLGLLPDRTAEQKAS